MLVERGCRFCGGLSGAVSSGFGKVEYLNYWAGGLVEKGL